MNKKSFRKYNKRYKKTSKKFSRKIKKRIFGGTPTIINIELDKTYIESFENNIIELISTLIVNNIQKPEGMIYWVSYLNKNIDKINNLKQDILNYIIERMPILFVIKDQSFYNFQLKNNNESHNNNRSFFKNLKIYTTMNNDDIYSDIKNYIRPYYTSSQNSIENVTEFQIDEKLNNLNKLYSIIDATEKRFLGKIPNNVLNNFKNIKKSIFNFKYKINVDSLKRLNKLKEEENKLKEEENKLNILQEDLLYTKNKLKEEENKLQEEENKLNKLQEDLLYTKNKLFECESNTGMPTYSPPPPPNIINN